MLNRIKMWSRVSFVYRVPISPYIYQPSDIANKLPGFSIKTNRIYESLQHFLCSKVKDWKRCECWNWPDGLYLRTIRNIAENEKDVKMKRPGWFDNTSKIYFKKVATIVISCRNVSSNTCMVVIDKWMKKMSHTCGVGDAISFIHFYIFVRFYLHIH